MTLSAGGKGCCGSMGGIKGFNLQCVSGKASLSAAASLPHPRFTFCADIRVGASLTVLRTSPANVGI